MAEKSTEKNRANDEAEIGFEVALSQLEDIVRLLEGGDLPLDEAIDRFQSGMHLVRVCREKLQAAEQKVEIVIASGQSITTVPFDEKE